MFGFYVILTIVVLFIAFMGGVIGYLIGKYWKIVMAREFEVNIRVTIDSKCKDSDDDIIEELMYGADKYFYPYCCNNEHIEHTNSTAHKIK